MKNKLFLLVVVGMFVLLLGNISAAQESLGTFKQNQCVKLIQTCENCTFVNITSVIYPNSSFILNIETAMTKAGTLYSYNFCDTNPVGIYTYTTHGNLDGADTIGNVIFEINSAGTPLNQARAIIYLGSLSILIFLFISTIIGSTYVPSRNNKGDDGKIISINRLKHFRPVLYAFAYILLLCILFVSSNISLAFLGNDMMGKLLFTLFQVGFIMMLPGVVIWLYYLIYTAYNDVVIEKMIKRGADIF